MNGKPGKSAILGLDIGTTNCKLIAYSCNGHILAEAVAGYEVHHPRPGFAELLPADMMSAVTSLLQSIAPAIAGSDDLSMAISAQGEAFVLVDKDGMALSAAPVSIDMRGHELIAAFKRRTDVQSASHTAGQALNSLTSLAKLLWFKDEAPDVLGQCAQVLCVGEYVLKQLGLCPAMDYSMASRTGLLDCARLQWSDELIGLAELPKRIFPPVVQSGSLVGTITREVAEKYGINVPINVFAGGHDQVCAMLGAGVVNSETALYSIGTTEAIALTIDGFQSDRVSEYAPPYPHVVPGKYVALMGNQTGGRLLDWFKKLRGIRDTEALFVDLPDLPSPVTVLPHFSGSGTVLADEAARGIIAGLNFQTTPQDLTHAVLEGITMEQALALRDSCNLEPPIKRLRAVGGGSRSSRWMQIKADVIGLPIDCLENPETACSGAAILAGVGSGALASREEAVTQFARVGPTYHPRDEYTEIYREKLDLYFDIYRSQKAHQAKQTALTARIAALTQDERTQESGQPAPQERQ
ncbi:MAG: FGGY-family carbohydrate kinase [Stappiaceae bacterium]